MTIPAAVQVSSNFLTNTFGSGNFSVKAAVELKHQNISAVLIELGYPYIDGYKPRYNFQKLLYEVIEDRLLNAVGLHQAAAAAVEQTVKQFPVVSDVLSILVSPPSREEDKPKLHDSAPRIRKPVRRNYLEIESRNPLLARTSK